MMPRSIFSCDDVYNSIEQNRVFHCMLSDTLPTHHAAPYLSMLDHFIPAIFTINGLLFDPHSYERDRDIVLTLGLTLHWSRGGDVIADGFARPFELALWHINKQPDPLRLCIQYLLHSEGMIIEGFSFNAGSEGEQEAPHDDVMLVQD